MLFLLKIEDFADCVPVLCSLETELSLGTPKADYRAFARQPDGKISERLTVLKIQEIEAKCCLDVDHGPQILGTDMKKKKLN